MRQGVLPLSLCRSDGSDTPHLAVIYVLDDVPRTLGRLVGTLTALGWEGKIHIVLVGGDPPEVAAGIEGWLPCDGTSIWEEMARWKVKYAHNFEKSGAGLPEGQD